MAGEQDIIRLPYRITDFNEDLIPLLNRNFAEIERMLSQLQLYEKKVGKPANETVDSITDNDGNVLTDKLSDKIVGLNHELQIAEQAVTTAKIALNAITEALLADGAVTNLKIAAGAVTEAKTNWQTHLLSDYGIADNTPQTGYVSWSNVKIVYKGVEYSVMDGSTDKLYVWWDFDYPTIMQTAQILPTMTDDDVLIFLNKNGTHLVVSKATVVDGSLLVSESVLTDALAANAVTAIKIAAGAVQTAALAADAVTAEKINVENLAAISANLGVIHAGYIQVGEILKNIIEMETESGAQAKADQTVSDFVSTVYDPDIANLQSQIDGQIATWFYDYEPTLSNLPTSEWTTDTEKNKHLGDLFYDSTTGYGYRFAFATGVYQWIRIQDADVVTALANAQAAQDTADSKRRVFTTTPTTPYDVGDLWAEGESGDLKRCKVARVSGLYVAADWELATKYTDDSIANQALSAAATAQEVADGQIQGFFQPNAPSSGMAFGDIWIDIDGHTPPTTADIYRYEDADHGSQGTLAWRATPTNAVGIVYLNAYTAQTTANSKIKTFYQANTPTASEIGDFWIDTDDNNHLYRWNESNWVSVRDNTASEELATFVSDIYTADKASLQTQIDGKIETYFQETDPNTWTVDDRPKHNGDMWYKASSKELKRYDSSTNTWALIEDQAAINAYEIASTAQDTADQKRRVFVTTPTPPYDVGDLWAPGATGIIKKCINAKTSEGSYSIDDWEIATDDVRYDGQVINDSNVTAYFPFDDSLYDSKNVIQGTFSRPSVAYLPNGVPVTSGIARYDTARIVRGILIEEGTTNLLTANQSSAETDTTGFVVFNSTIFRDTTKKWSGNASLKVITNTGTVDGGVEVDFAVTAGLIYTVSGWYTADTNLAMRGTVQDPNLTWNDFVLPAAIAGTWQRFSKTFTAIATGTAKLFIEQSGTGSATFYVDGLQVEQKSYATSATSWILGSTTRSSEILTIPTAGVFNKGNWTVELTYIPTSEQNNGEINYIWDCYIDVNNRYVIRTVQSGLLQCVVWSNGVAKVAGTSTPLLTDVSYSIMFSGDGSVIRLCVNGVQMAGGDLSYSEPIGTLPVLMYVGDKSVLATEYAFQANGIIDELRFSKVARTLEEHQAYYTSGRSFIDQEPIMRMGTSYKGFMVTPDGTAKCYHVDGSFTQMSADGFLRFVAGLGKEYHYLTEINRVSTVGNDFHTSYPWWTETDVLTRVPIITIQLPSDFKGKNFKVFAEARLNDNNVQTMFENFGAYGSSTVYWQMRKFIVEVLNIDYTNATFQIKAYAQWRKGSTVSTTEDEGCSGIDVTYTVTA
jgi:hypothetical protein